MNYFKKILSFGEVDTEGTIQEIKNGIVFEGSRVWVLACSIIMASIGLNINSLAVIIGAMLIAPLMSPILGIGTSLGTNDWDTLKKSTRGLLVAIGVSLTMGTLYFLVSPIKEPSAEIMARTVPTFLDILIALVGGIACIITFSLKSDSKDKSLAATVIPGVAVGTALMPPLCTAAFGIASGNLEYFGGAFYLFILNAVFIATPAYLYVQVFNFPKVNDSNPRHKGYIVLIILLIAIPSGYLFYGVAQESIFRVNASEYVVNVIKHDGSKVITYTADYDNKTIEVFLLGDLINNDIQKTWRNELSYHGLEKVDLVLNQQKDNSQNIAKSLTDQVTVEVVEALYRDKEQQLQEKNNRIVSLEIENIKSKQELKYLRDSIYNANIILDTIPIE